ncbi:metallopeptidase family protein [Microbacterium sp. YY-01]|uniref:metallopeptidase family protein n=1 Tax=Microbacterium sp. YY-01 TaxID=3421634 RepID=UPI003D166DBC
MPRRRSSRRAAPRLSRHGRHGRVGRSPVVRPPLPAIDGRMEVFDMTVTTAVEYLRGAWPELRDVQFEVAMMPTMHDPRGIPRWHIDTEARRIVLFRIPIERLLIPGHDDELHRRFAIEGAVFRAAAEYAGRNPWDLGIPPFGDHDH